MGFNFGPIICPKCGRPEGLEIDHPISGERGKRYYCTVCRFEWTEKYSTREIIGFNKTLVKFIWDACSYV